MKKEDVKLLHPGKLKKRIDLYGYHFDAKSYAFAVVLLLFAVGIMGKLLYLENKYILVVAVIWCIGLPFFIHNLFAIMYEQRRFLEAKTYMENILYAFRKRRGKILTALEDVLELYEPGKLKTALENAITFIRRGNYDDDLYREALAGIEALYPCERIGAIHDFMISVEFSGGEFERQAGIMISDINEWEFETASLQQAKKAKINESYGAMILGVGCCIVVLALQQKFLPEKMGIAKLPITQLTSMALLIIEMGLILLSQRKLKTDWLATPTSKKSREGKKDYDYLKTFNPKKEKRESALLSAPFLALALVSAIRFRNFYACVGFLFATYLMLHQHHLNYRIAFSRVKEQIRSAFPMWITKMTLLLQTNNVQVAIAKSVEYAPEILRIPLEQLVEKIKEAPTDVRSYLSFLGEFDDPDIRTTMQILYAMSETGCADAQLQLNDLSAANMKLKNDAEKIRHKEVLADIELVSGAPLVACAIKQFCDLAVFLVYSLPALSTMYQ